jgi:hypothetical protein
MPQAEDLFIDHPKRTRHRHSAAGGDDQRGDQLGYGMGGRGPEKLAHDESALPAETDMPAQVVVDPVIRERAEEDDERKDGGQQGGAEQDDGVDEVQGAEFPDEDLRE